MIKVLVVDDHTLIRKGIILLLTNYADIEVVGEASDGEQAIQMASQLEPDVILMDVSIPTGLDGFNATIVIKKQHPNVKIIMLTMHNEVTYIQKAIDLDADGYILKNSQGGELYDAVKAVANGQRFYSVGLPEEHLERLFKNKGQEKKDVLSNREQEIVKLTILGFSNKQIAEKLFISVKTVENHKTNIMQKLHLKDKSELIQYGIANKYIE